MKRNKLSEVHQKQFEDMAKDKDKKAVEIIRFFEENYKIKILASKISVFRKKLGWGKKGRPAVAKEKGPAVPKDKVEDLEDIANEMISLIKETRQATHDVLSAVRLELLKSHNEVFRMKKGLNV